ncbi:phosphatase PAP2 family protein [Flavobacterium sp. 7A]|uniref:phosphatase PAP2 family protein n=1 Tax=Flavobacterium sp. 7A TaxID=2940571 RepID=UPI002227380D|nr:phosphatase PAP2 family protein [Flavobacterium sp. 7A]MCW2118100.1 membrane-associated phospholipid phosphatase [Flavobacterium sp. 7A]
MKKLPIVLFLCLLITQMNGQIMDSVSKSKKLSYKTFILPAALVATGTVLLNSQLNSDIQNNANRFFGSKFHTQLDNLTVFMPLGQIYAGRLFGFESKNTVKHQTISIVTANALSYGLVTILKNAVKSHRPDASDQLSFPSGHSAIAFTNAALLFQEYKDDNLWYASSGFLFATATGVLRIANNKHFASDVLVGAGIGLASGFLVTYWNPLQNLHLGRKKKGTALVYPQFGNQIGIGAVILPNF